MKNVYVIEVGFGRQRWIYAAFHCRKQAKKAFDNLPVIKGANVAELLTYVRPPKKQRSPQAVPNKEGK
jgi:hypothetical protein